MTGPSPEPQHVPSATAAPVPPRGPVRGDALDLALRYHTLLLGLDRWNADVEGRAADPAAPKANLRGQAEAHARYLMEELGASATGRSRARAACRAVPLLLDLTADPRTPHAVRAVPVLIEEGAARMDLFVPRAPLAEAMLILLTLAADGCKQTPRLSLSAARLSPLAARLSGLTKRAHLRLSVGAPTDAEELMWRPSLVALRTAAITWRGRLLRTANTTGGWRLCLDLPGRDVA